MFDALYQWAVSIVSWILSWFGISLANRSVGGAEMGPSEESVVEAPSVYSIQQTMEPQPMDS